jgi:arylsulfatase A
LIFTADNGSAKQAVHGMREHGHDSCDGRRGWKATWFEGGHRVPCVVRWPNGIQGAGRFDDAMITLEDFFATVADILGQPMPDEAGDSVSFLPQLQGKPQDRTQRQLIVSSLSNMLVLRHGKWKLICVSEKELVDRVEARREDRRKIPGPIAAWHEQVVLYDMKQDMAETTNVARQNTTVVARIAGLAIDAFKNGRTNSGPARPNSCSEPQIELLTLLSTLR